MTADADRTDGGEDFAAAVRELNDILAHGDVTLDRAFRDLAEEEDVD